MINEQVVKMKIYHILILATISIFLSSMIKAQSYEEKRYIQQNTEENIEEVSIQSESIGVIIDVATNYARQQIPDHILVESLTGTLLNDVFSFPKCSNELEAFTSGSFRLSRQFAIGVRCNSPSWKIYVPIKAELLTEVIVANKTILKNEVIEQHHLNKEIKPYKGSYQRYMSSMKDIVGKIAKRNIGSGKMIRASQLKTNYLVKKKQQVMIIASNERFQVQMKGIALNHGHKNDIIKVRNSSSNKIVEAVIIKPGKVKVNF